MDEQAAHVDGSGDCGGTHVEERCYWVKVVVGLVS